jgi:transposase
MEAGVELVYLSPYSLDLNLIEEFFAETKAFIKRDWHVYEKDSRSRLRHFPRLVYLYN